MSIERKYQVFVSSTYEDLRGERERVQRALLETDCIPIGMELFPPSDEAQWEYIKRVIDQCDYYVLILAGRYGSLDASTGLSYTEREYRYAEEKKKPIITFYHHNPAKLPHDLVEQDPDSQRKLEAFRKLALSKLCRQYSDASELYGCVINGINHLKKLRPDGGWIPAKYLPSADTQAELTSLSREIARLRQQLSEAGKGSVHAIDVKPNHVAAQSAMEAYLSEALRTSDTVSVKVMAVALHFTWEFLQNKLPPLLEGAPPHKKVDLELLMVEPAYLGELGLTTWHRRGEVTKQSIGEFMRRDREEAGHVPAGRLNLSLIQYRNIPHWHGVLIQNHMLFLGRTRWTVSPSRRAELTVGEEVYRLFASNDEFGGADRITLFDGWFDYYRHSGQVVTSTTAREG